jgi:putative hydrolase of HD superfamily
MLQVCTTIAHLKKVYRQGWLQRGIPVEKCGSVADHSYSVAVIAMIFNDTSHTLLDAEKLIKMALLHDIGEIIVGDITPQDGINKEKKYEMEKKAVQQIFEPIHLDQNYLNIWEEYEKGESIEAIIINQIDKLEMIIQASIYEKEEPIDLDEFFKSTKNHFTEKEIVEIVSILENFRK